MEIQKTIKKQMSYTRYMDAMLLYESTSFDFTIDYWLIFVPFNVLYI